MVLWHTNLTKELEGASDSTGQVVGVVDWPLLV